MRKILIILFLLNINTFAQWKEINSSKIEILTSLETTLLLGDKHYETNIKKTYSDIYPVSLYLNFLFYTSANIALEIKPGLVFGGDIYTGADAGLFVRYYFESRKYFASLGLNLHQNFSGGHGLSLAVRSSGESFLFYGIKFGYKPKENFAFTLGYYFLPGNNWLFLIRDSSDISKSYSVNLNYAVKLGFELTL